MATAFAVPFSKSSKEDCCQARVPCANTQEERSRSTRGSLLMSVTIQCTTFLAGNAKRHGRSRAAFSQEKSLDGDGDDLRAAHHVSQRSGGFVHCTLAGD